MIAFPAGVKVWIAGGVTDMRRGMNTLALQVKKVTDWQALCVALHYAALNQMGISLQMENAQSGWW